MVRREHKQSLRHVPNHPSYKVVARVYKNAKRVDEVIWLHQCYWQYVDLLETQGEISFAEWVVHCDNNPFEDWTLSHLLMYWLWSDECGRFREGLPTPKPYPPLGYEGWADEYHAARVNNS